MSVHGLLATGPDDALRRFHLAVCFLLNAHTRRDNTVHYGCMGEHMEAAKEAARVADVTLQEIVTVGTKNHQAIDLPGGANAVVSDCIEEYPILHTGSHGLKWESPKPPGKKRRATGS